MRGYREEWRWGEGESGILSRYCWSWKRKVSWDSRWRGGWRSVARRCRAERVAHMFEMALASCARNIYNYRHF
jgi:hypothetical protein